MFVLHLIVSQCGLIRCWLVFKGVCRRREVLVAAGDDCVLN